ncbi:MAG: hypothetical protein IJ491_01510 [Clostridia bacterium]|nr:hypothetical protein [Clostridia bacterium]
MKKLKHLIFVLFVMVLFLPYFFVEINTMLYKDEFDNLYLQTQEISDDNYCKVFDKNEKYSKVFYATETSTFMCYFFRDDTLDKWILDRCEILWSSSGSASKFSFPFYPVKNFKTYFGEHRGRLA